MDRQSDRDGRLAARNVITVILVIGAVALLAIGAGFVSRRAATHAVSSAPAAADVDQGSLPVTVPLRHVGGHLLVDVSFGGGEPARPMLLDTGAPTIVPPQLSAELGAVPMGHARLAPLGGSARDVPAVHIPELSIGGARFTNVPALVAAPGSDSPLADIVADGIVGGSLLGSAVWQIDYVHRQLTIAADLAGLAHVESAATLAIMPSASDAASPIVELRIDGAAVPVLIDTGSDAGLIVHPDALGAGSPAAPARPAVVDGWDGRRRVVAWSAIADVRVGAGPGERQLLGVTTALPAGTGIMGNGFLAGHVLTIDMRTRQVHISQT